MIEYVVSKTQLMLSDVALKMKIFATYQPAVEKLN